MVIDLLFLLKQAISLPIWVRLHIPHCWSHYLCYISHEKSGHLFWGRRDKCDYRDWGGNFLTDNLFQCILLYSFECSPRWWNVLPIQINCGLPTQKGRSTQVLHLISDPAELCCTPMLWKSLTDVAWGQAMAWMVVNLQALPCVAIFMPPSSLWKILGDSHKFVIHHRSHSGLNAIFPQRGFIKRKFMP